MIAVRAADKCSSLQLGAPPPIEEASNNLQAPEATPPLTGKIDARSLRRSGRTMQFATRVSPEFDARIRRIAQREGLLLVEILEKALDVYEKQLDSS
jgi:hypothetical protein